MSPLISLLFALAISNVAFAQAPVRDTSGTHTNVPAGTAQMSGRVLLGDTGKPVRRAVVRISSSALPQPRTVSTDVDGRWTVGALPAGQYVLSASKAGFITVFYGQRRAFQPGAIIDVENRQVVEKLDIILPKGGVVQGRVADEFGDPFAGARVTVMRYRFVNGQPRTTPVDATDTTDDTGQYRLHGLAPGEYVVYARTSESAYARTEDKVSYVSTYYPGTLLPSEAQRITVGFGQETSGIDFTLAPVRVARISGSVVSSDGKPAPAMVMLNSTGTLAAGRSLQMLNAVEGNPNGQFTISGVPPGDYVVTTYTSRGLEAVAATGNSAALSLGESAATAVSITGADVTDLLLVTSPAATATGRVVFAKGASPDIPTSSVRVQPLAANAASPMSRAVSATVKSDWTFEVRGLLGPHVFRAAAPAGWMLTSVMMNGQNVIDRIVDFQPGQTYRNIEITLAPITEGIAGAVETADGRPTSDYVIVAFVADRSKWEFATRFVQAARPNQSGAFSIKGLPPGDYLLAVTPYLEPGDENDPELLESLKATAVSVTVDDGPVKHVMLKLPVGR